MKGLPHEVTVVEVGPRDGLQNEKAVVPDVTEDCICRSADRRGASRD